MRSSLWLIAVCATAVAACGASDGPVAIQTSQPSNYCDAARVAGVLVADPTWGLAFAAPGGVEGVVWPFGYSARRESGVVRLIDPSGRIVAREGDHIVAAGAFGDHVAYAECEVQVVPAESP